MELAAPRQNQIFCLLIDIVLDACLPKVERCVMTNHHAGHSFDDRILKLSSKFIMQSKTAESNENDASDLVQQQSIRLSAPTPLRFMHILAEIVPPASSQARLVQSGYQKVLSIKMKSIHPSASCPHALGPASDSTFPAMHVAIRETETASARFWPPKLTHSPANPPENLRHLSHLHSRSLR